MYHMGIENRRNSKNLNNISVISWRSVLLVEENRNTNKTPPTYRKTLKTLSHNVVSSTPHLSGIRTHNFSDDMY
jgi:hypothetical protein